MYVCVYIYLFLTDQFPSWYVKVNVCVQLLGPLSSWWGWCQCIAYGLQNNPRTWLEVQSIGMPGVHFSFKHI